MNADIAFNLFAAFLFLACIMLILGQATACLRTRRERRAQAEQEARDIILPFFRALEADDVFWVRNPDNGVKYSFLSTIGPPSDAHDPMVLCIITHAGAIRWTESRFKGMRCGSCSGPKVILQRIRTLQPRGFSTPYAPLATLCLSCHEKHQDDPVMREYERAFIHRCRDVACRLSNPPAAGDGPYRSVA